MTTPSPQSAGPATADQVADHFAAIAFDSDTSRGRNAIARWAGPVRWTIASNVPGGWLRHHDMVAAQMQTLAAVTGLDIQEAEDRDAANFKIALGSRGDFRKLARASGGSFGDVLRGANWNVVMCHAFSAIDPDLRTINGAYVAIIDPAPEAHRQTCVIIELTQAMGLLRDAAVLTPSVAEEGHFTLTELPRHDEVALRTLYDPRLQPGMSRAEAMPIARQIIRELWQP